MNNVRSHELFTAQIDPALTLVLGRNGTGKTTLLESLHYALRGTSFRGRDRDLIAHASTRADLVVVDEDGERRASLQQLPDDRIKKLFIIESKTTARLPAKYRRPVVLFEPDELRLISSSPERRRRFFDGILSRLYPQYGVILSRYQRTLLQRNELLKRRESVDPASWDAHLFAWDIKFAELAREITRQRREFVVTANSHLSRLYSTIADSQHHVVASYHSNVAADNYEQVLLSRLHSQRLADSFRGYTSVGPHRDDTLFTLDGHPANEVASRGEMRTIMLAIKLLEVELQQAATNQSPLILLDDVFSELDTQREKQLMATLQPFQTIITATDLRDELKTNASIIKL